MENQHYITNLNGFPGPIVTDMIDYIVTGMIDYRSLNYTMSYFDSFYTDIETLELLKRARRVLQKKLRTSTRLVPLTQDSCFSAHVKEALKDLETLKQQHHQELALKHQKVLQSAQDRKTAITRLEYRRKLIDPRSIVTIPMIFRFWESDGHNFDIKSLDPTKMTQEAYDTLVDIIEFLEISRLHKLLLRAMILCFIALNTFLGLMVESSDSKAKIQEIKAKLQDKFNYNGSCKVKIGIIPERSGTPFLKMGVLRPAPMLQKVHSTQLVLRLSGAKHISREYDITSNVSELSTSEAILLIRGF